MSVAASEVFVAYIKYLEMADRQNFNPLLYKLPLYTLSIVSFGVQELSNLMSSQLLILNIISCTIRITLRKS